MTETEKVATRAIIPHPINEDRILFGRRAQGMGKGLLALFGGKPEPEDESLEATIQREVGEELGVLFTKPELFAATQDFNTQQGVRWRVFYYTGRTEGAFRPKQDEVSELAWLTREQITKRTDIAFDHQQRILEYFAKKNSTE